MPQKPKGIRFMTFLSYFPCNIGCLTESKNRSLPVPQADLELPAVGNGAAEAPAVIIPLRDQALLIGALLGPVHVTHGSIGSIYVTNGSIAIRQPTQRHRFINSVLLLPRQITLLLKDLDGLSIFSKVSMRRGEVTESHVPSIGVALTSALRECLRGCLEPGHEFAGRQPQRGAVALPDTK